MKRKSIIPTQYPQFRQEVYTFNLDVIKDTFDTDVIPDDIVVDNPTYYILYFYNMHLTADLYDIPSNNYSDYTQLLFRGVELSRLLYTVDSNGGDIVVNVDKSIYPDTTSITVEYFILRASIARLIP